MLEMERSAANPVSSDASNVAPSKETPEARERRIAEIERSIESGTYRVDALELSKKIIDKHIRRPRQ